MSNDHAVAQPNGVSRRSSGQDHSWDHRNHASSSPASDSRERSPSDTATSPFPLNDIDYESSPAGLAQELSNLQALRRMSMHIGATDDPDLPQLSAAGMPSAPSPTSSEDDSSRLFWVPARLHPELAPKEFKTFLESKAEQIRRRSGELSAFATPSSSRSSSLSTEGGSSGLRRKKSMLSRQIDSSVGYQDGADRLERKRSLSRRAAPQDPNLQELENLVANTPGLSRTSLEPSSEDDAPDVILPSVPGSSLKRSTRTTYRRGGSVKGRGDRGTYAQRAARRAAAGSPSSSRPESPESSVPAVPPLPNLSMEIPNLAQTLKDPSSATNVGKTTPTNFSRPANSSSASGTSSVSTTFDYIFSNDDVTKRTTPTGMPASRKSPPPPISPPSTSTSFDRKPVPQIVETPPPAETPPVSVQPPRSSSMTPPPAQQQVRHPERVSSREDSRTRAISPQRPSMPSKGSMPVITPRTTSPANQILPQSRPSQSLEQPSPLPGNDTNTSNLSFIPTLTVDKRAEPKKKEETKKSSWSWLLGKEDGDKDKSEKPKAKISKPPQQHDNTRLDVLQTSIDGGVRGRESLVLDREHLKLDEERKKESQRKASGSDKKEKESLFSSIFGGKKSKGDKDGSSKKYRDRGLSPEPPYRELKPDIDYNWTRFSILEERAIYRMAHIKLANPRRALYSQVLLSNFMYSYLAKVQQMHPQMNLPTSAKQQRKQQQKDQQQQQQQPDEYVQYQRYQQQQAQQQQQSLQAEQSYGSQQDFVGDSSSYEYEAGSTRPSSRGSKHSIESNGSAYGGGVGAYNQYYHNNQLQEQLHQTGSRQGGSQLDEDDDDMW
ncbi:uncharacterized protein A1O5_03949 [Cladophialophora psammophila CBS 110553]|uniref:Protein Zds1 C-terminal domain-containing protein n=1 Tax=Cladophialophora psammophila CBS 110553 TaxID=1182543 RepID=W9WX63_9EURO|nr:uncharacterized protein A1O5_03949 [Cladophialophora psammophila CBS 110553]EXJ72802.1 hypothetical protein A1O5_03949 [Cladophialophora psammophila CBS 110553]